MLIVAIKDKLAQKFVQFIPSTNLDVVKRDLKNAVKQPTSIFCTNSEDFDVYKLGDLDETSGVITPTQDMLFNLHDLKDDPQVL